MTGECQHKQWLQLSTASYIYTTSNASASNDQLWHTACHSYATSVTDMHLLLFGRTHAIRQAKCGAVRVSDSLFTRNMHLPHKIALAGCHQIRFAMCGDSSNSLWQIGKLPSNDTNDGWCTMIRAPGNRNSSSNFNPITMQWALWAALKETVHLQKNIKQIIFKHVLCLKCEE